MPEYTGIIFSWHFDPVAGGCFYIPALFAGVIFHPALIVLGGNPLVPVLPDIRSYIGVVPDPAFRTAVIVTFGFRIPDQHLVIFAHGVIEQPIGAVFTLCKIDYGAEKISICRRVIALDDSSITADRNLLNLFALVGSYVDRKEHCQSDNYPF